MTWYECVLIVGIFWLAGRTLLADEEE